MENLTVTAAIIVKNEERCISRCVNSIINFFDEIVIVDTGSDDNTIGIIKGFNSVKIKIYLIKWSDSFSDPRNAAIERSTSNYIFFIDADEFLEIPKKDIPNIIKVAKKNDTHHHIVLCPKIIDHNKNATSSIGRILPNNGMFFYHGYIHEELRVKDDSNYLLIPVDITLHHDGYVDEIIKRKNKSERNKKLNTLNIKIEPENLRWHYFYYRDLFYLILPNEIYSSLLRNIKLHDNAPLSYENLKKGTYTFAILDLMARACLRKKSHRDDFYLITDLMDIIIPNNSNSVYYKAIYELLNWHIKSITIIHNLVSYRKNNHQFHEDMLHSDGLHIDAAISFYLYEKNYRKHAKKLLLSVHDCGFQTELTNEYLKKIISTEDEQ